MAALKNVDDLTKLRESLKKELQTANAEKPIITIGMGTCGLAAGAGETYKAIQKELENRNLQATIRSVGCIGMCVREPLVDVQLAGQPRVTYANVRPAHVARIIEEHIIKGNVVQEWAIGFVPPEW